MCKLLEEPLHCIDTSKCSSWQGRMLSHKPLLVQRGSTWLGHFLVLLEESDSLLLMLYKVWAHWTQISLKNNKRPEKNKVGLGYKSHDSLAVWTVQSRLVVFFRYWGERTVIQVLGLGRFWFVFSFLVWFTHLPLGFLKLRSSPTQTILWLFFSFSLFLWSRNKRHSLWWHKNTSR